MESKKFLFMVIFLVLLSCSSSVTIREEEGVIVMTNENFDQVIKNHDYIMVEFYAPWCSHCKKLAPEYVAAAKQLKKDNIVLGKLDGSVHKEAASKQKLQGFPTLRFFIKGLPVDYEGGRTSGEIVAWIRKKIGSASKPFTSAVELENFIKEHKIIIVFFGESHHPSFSVFETVAKSYEDISFAHCGTIECTEYLKAQRNSVVIFKKFDEGRNDHSEGFTATSLKSFIETNQIPTVMNFDEKTAQIIFGKASPGIFLFRDINSESSAPLEAAFASAAKKLRGKLHSVVSDIKEGLESRLAEFLGVNAADLPSIRIADTKGDLKKFVLEGELTEQNILKFVDEWKGGLLTPHFKSEPVPERQDGDVTVVVGKTFKEIVLDESKDVVLELYAPWCGHCKKLAPVYEELARKLKHNRNLVIAKMDASANEIENLHVKGFPTIKLYSSGRKRSPSDYEGDRSLEDMVKWISRYATFPITDNEKTDL